MAYLSAKKIYPGNFNEPLNGWYKNIDTNDSGTNDASNGGPNAQVLINNNDDFSRFIILIWQLYAGFEILNKDFVTTAYSFVSDDGTV